MKKNRNKKKTIPTKYTLLILTFCCVVAFFLSLTLNISGGPLKIVAGYVYVPMQTGINKAGGWLSSKANEFKTLSEVLKENEKLQAEVDDLTTQLTTIKLEQYDLNTLQELYELDEKYPSYDKIVASVVAKDSGNWFHTFTVNKGSKDGVTVGMNVLAGCGLVGIVTEVGPNYATVRSIIDDTSNVSAMVETTGDNFNVSGNLQTMNESQVISFSELKDTNNEVKEGDPVVTSYVSDQYQQGFLIGYITSIEENSNNLTKSGTITPVVDFEHIREVLIIKDLKENGKESKKKKTSKKSEEGEDSTENSTQNTEDSGNSDKEEE